MNKKEIGKERDRVKKDNPKIEDVQQNKEMPFGKMNYILVLVGIAVIALGFILMVGGGSSDPDVFNEEMFNFRRITLAPILCLLGFAIEVFAIMTRFKDKK